MVLAAMALLKPCFFKNKVNTALASSFSAANRVGGMALMFNDPSVPEQNHLFRIVPKPNNNRNIKK